MDTKTIVVDGKEVTIKIPKRYTDKRRVEKQIQKLQGIQYKEKKVKKRQKEFTIPIKIDQKTNIFVRESRIYDEKWLKYFKSKEHLDNYIQAYKKQNEAKNTIQDSKQ